MARYTNLNRPTSLALGDTVEFTIGDEVFSHTVAQLRRSNRLYLNYDNGGNRAVFDALDITDDDVTSFARAAYGYAPTGNKFPRANAGDFAALTRLVNAIYDRILVEGADPAPAPAPVKAPAPAPVTVKAGKYMVVVSLTDAGITITIN
jgi:hypothetical protein